METGPNELEEEAPRKRILPFVRIVIVSDWGLSIATYPHTIMQNTFGCLPKWPCPYKSIAQYVLQCHCSFAAPFSCWSTHVYVDQVDALVASVTDCCERPGSGSAVAR